MRPDGGEMRQAVARASIGRQLASALRREILLGHLDPGTPLVQEQLCEQYDVSRIPVRDALQRLDAEGFVSRNRRNQMVVNGFTKQDLFDTFHLEALIAGVAARRAAETGTEQEFAEIREILRAGEGLNQETDREQLADIAWRFHRKINLTTHSLRLLAALRAVSIHFVQDFGRELPGWWSHSSEEHHEILAALEDRDASKSEQLMFEHFEHAGKALVSFVWSSREANTARD